MKKQFFVVTIVAAMAAAAMTACSENALDAESEVMNAEPTEVRMTFSPYDMAPMTRAVAVECSAVLPTRAATRAAVSDFATRLDIWIYQGGTEVQAIHQQKTDEDFASLAVTLDKTKTYTLYAVAHKGTDVATLSNGVVSFPGDKVTHTFFYSTTFSPATSTVLTCQMERIVGNFIIETTDQKPAEVQDMAIHIGSSPVAWNVAGYGVQPQDRTATFANVSSRSDGTVALSCFIIADSDEAENYDITLSATAADGSTVQSRTFADVPIRNGYKTQYRGAFFIDEDITATFTVSDWNSFDIVEF